MTRISGAALVVLAAAAIAATAGGAAIPSPTQVAITMTGTVRPNPSATGNFTAAAPLCTAGTFAETDNSLGIADVILTCADGTGTIELKVPADFTVLDGTGNYAKLVGGGSCLVDPTPGGGYIRTCNGAVGFDTKPPAVSGEKLTTSRVPKATVPTYVVQVAFVASDDTDVQNYRVAILAGKRRVAGSSGPGESGRTTMKFRVKPPSGAKSLTVQLTLRDSLGNAGTTTKTVSLG